MRIYLSHAATFSLAICLLFVGLTDASAENNFQHLRISLVDFRNPTIRISNISSEAVQLDGLRICTSDENEIRRYTSASAFNGRVLQPSRGVRVLFNNDADKPDEVNISDLGDFAQPLDTDGAYAIQLFYRSPLDNTDKIVGYLQFSLGGVHNDSADEHVAGAVSSNIWEDENDWIPVTLKTGSIGLNNAFLPGNPKRYVVFERPMVTARIVDTVLFVNGTQFRDEIRVRQFSNDNFVLETEGGTCSRRLEPIRLSRVVVNGFGGGDDIITNVTVPTLINGGFGPDLIIGGSAPNELFGGPGPDMIIGSFQEDHINSGRGRDIVDGAGGDDFIIGGDADDILHGGSGNDTILGGIGGDWLLGEVGDDVLVGNVGADTLEGGLDNDDLSGLGGPDQLLGGHGNDQLRGGEGFDTLNGGEGSDTALDAGEVEIDIEQ